MSFYRGLLLSPLHHKTTLDPPWRICHILFSSRFLTVWLGTGGALIHVPNPFLKFLFLTFWKIVLSLIAQAGIQLAVFLPQACNTTLGWNTFTYLFCLLTRKKLHEGQSIFPACGTRYVCTSYLILMNEWRNDWFFLLIFGMWPGVLFRISDRTSCNLSYLFYLGVEKKILPYIVIYICTS